MSSARDIVLLVDDEPQVLVALEDLLSDEFVVLKADSGEQALEVAKREPNLAVVLTDQRMPRMCGDDLVARLARCSSAERIMVTGFADLSAVVRAVNEGRLFAYVSKPWHPEDLRLKVAHAAQHFRLVRELSEERQLLHDLMDNIPNGIYFKDAELRFRRANQAFARLLGDRPEAIYGRTLAEVWEDEEDAKGVEAEERSLLAEGRSSVERTRKAHLDGVERWFTESKAPIRGAGGQVIGLVGIIRDVTERHAEEERVARVARMRSVVSSMNAAVLRVHDHDELLSELCRTAVNTGGFTAGVVLDVGKAAQSVRPVSLAPPDNESVRRFADLVRRSASLAWAEAATQDGARPVIIDDVSAAPLGEAGAALVERGIRSLGAFPLSAKGDGPVLVLLSDEDTLFEGDQLRLLNEAVGNVSFALSHIGQSRQIEFLSYHDPLTALPNRQLLVDRMAQQLAAHERSGLKFALVLLDLGRFRHINDTVGRKGGDTLLIEVGNRLLDLPRVGTVARFDGNVFALLLPAVENEAAVAAFVETELADALREPFLIEDTEVRVSTSIGIALFPSDGDRTELLIGSAEAALKKAKGTFQPYLFYAPTMNAQVAEQLALETRLRRAVERDEFVLHYQPKVELRSGKVVGLEALIRWNDPAAGLVPPGQFVPVLEATGLIREVGRWVFERAALQYHDWHTSGIVAPRIAVNVSALQLAARDFIPRVDRVLQAYPPGGAGVDLEITESVFVEDLAGSIEKLEAARERGMSVVIDDFGTGYSSLSYLARLPIDALKIDRSFVSRMVEDPHSTSIVTTIISLAHSLELKVVAEGVETRQQAQFLRLLKCDEIQGYLVSRPVPAEEIPPLLGVRFTPSTLPVA